MFGVKCLRLTAVGALCCAFAINTHAGYSIPEDGGAEGDGGQQPTVNFGFGSDLEIYDNKAGLIAQGVTIPATIVEPVVTFSCLGAPCNADGETVVLESSSSAPALCIRRDDNGDLVHDSLALCDVHLEYYDVQVDVSGGDLNHWRELKVNEPPTNVMDNSGVRLRLPESSGAPTKTYDETGCSVDMSGVLDQPCSYPVGFVLFKNNKAIEKIAPDTVAGGGQLEINEVLDIDTNGALANRVCRGDAEVGDKEFVDLDQSSITCKTGPQIITKEGNTTAINVCQGEWKPNGSPSAQTINPGSDTAQFDILNQGPCEGQLVNGHDVTIFSTVPGEPDAHATCMLQGSDGMGGPARARCFFAEPDVYAALCAASGDLVDVNVYGYFLNLLSEPAFVAINSENPAACE